jgi:hypothetical protein
MRLKLVQAGGNAVRISYILTPSNPNCGCNTLQFADIFVSYELRNSRDLSLFCRSDGGKFV